MPERAVIENRVLFSHFIFSLTHHPFRLFYFMELTLIFPIEYLGRFKESCNRGKYINILDENPMDDKFVNLKVDTSDPVMLFIIGMECGCNIMNDAVEDTLPEVSARIAKYILPSQN